MKLSKRRLELLRQLERIVGNECFNASIQNWGPNGTFYGAGREFRYPITFTREDGMREKRRGAYDDLVPAVQVTGRYGFGANELHIMRALDKVVRHLEQKHAFKL